MYKFGHRWQFLICASALSVLSADAHPANLKDVLQAYDAGNFDQAMTLCKDVLRAEPRNLSAHYVMGNICVKKNDIKDAKAQYEYCVKAPGAKDSSEASYARRALDQLQQNAAAPLTGGQNSNGNTFSAAPRSGSGKSAEQYIQEETDRLNKESQEKLAVKKRTLDDKIAQIQEDMRQQLSNLPRLSARRVAQQEARSEAQDQIKQEGQRRIESLKKDYDREAEDINQSYQNRITALSDHFHNVDSQSSGRSGSR